MSDDLVKRLREYAIHMDAWGKEANHDADIVDEAADRIEKLEAALREIADGAVADNADDACHVLMKIARKTLGDRND